MPKPVTKADRWRLKKLAEGLCGTCGNGWLFTKHHCFECAVRVRDKARNYYRKRHGIPLDAPIETCGRPRIA